MSKIIQIAIHWEVSENFPNPTFDPEPPLAAYPSYIHPENTSQHSPTRRLDALF